jgi:hypothetical protein
MTAVQSIISHRTDRIRIGRRPWAGRPSIPRYIFDPTYGTATLVRTHSAFPCPRRPSDTLCGYSSMNAAKSSRTNERDRTGSLESVPLVFVGTRGTSPRIIRRRRLFLVRHGHGILRQQDAKRVSHFCTKCIICSNRFIACARSGRCNSYFFQISPLAKTKGSTTTPRTN